MEPMIKGYVVQHSARFFLASPEICGQTAAGTVAKVKARLASQPTAWHPRGEVVEIWRAIVAAHPDEAGARAALVACGKAVGGGAGGTFLKLLFKVLTPRMFANKLPDLWLRDSNSGRIEIQSIDDKSMRSVFRDVSGFEHIGPVAEGWVGFALESLGLKRIVATSGPWSRAEPAPEEIRFEYHWQ